MKQVDQRFGGAWTEEKLGILRHYLGAYTTALKNQPFELVYVDAFAGTGYRQIEQTEAQELIDIRSQETMGFLDGSARMALEIDDKPFDRCVFVESDPAKCVELEALREDHPKRAIEVIKGDANEVLQRWCCDQDWSRQRAVLFLDPFATQVRWNTIQAVARTRCIDTWTLFPVGAIQRLLPKDRGPERIAAQWRERLDSVFGSSDWQRVFYQRKDDVTLFGKEEQDRKIATAEVILDFFISRLEEEFAATCREYRVLCNSKKSPLFGFCFAASNPQGAPTATRIARHILENL